MTILITPKHPFIQCSLEVAVLCQPLETVGIHHFTYSKQFKGGGRVSLSNKPQWIADYYNLNLYQSSLFETEQVTYSSNFYVFFGDYDLDVYRHGKTCYNTMHSISIIEPAIDGCEFYLFATTPDNAAAIHFLNNNREILYHFISYFRDNGRSLLKTSSQHKITLPVAQKPAFDNELLLGKTWADRKKNFFKQTPLKRFVLEQQKFQEIHLTPKEMQCVFFTLHNKTSKEIGQLMNISFRTVESYLENIKIKLNLSSRAELIEQLSNNAFLKSLFLPPGNEDQPG